MELLVFQRLLNEWSGKLEEGMPVLARGRISVRDEKAPQLMAESFRLFTGPDRERKGEAAPPPEDRKETISAPVLEAEAEGEKPKTLWARFPSMDSPQYKRLQLILIMFPGQEPIKVHFADTKKTLAASCWIHPSLVRELKEMLGEENVVIR